MLAGSSSGVEAVRCAVEVQRGGAERNANVPEEDSGLRCLSFKREVRGSNIAITPKAARAPIDL
jgi:hypothetical protein